MKALSQFAIERTVRGIDLIEEVAGVGLLQKSFLHLHRDGLDTFRKRNREFNQCSLISVDVTTAGKWRRTVSSKTHAPWASINLRVYATEAATVNNFGN